jgi:predicted acylesterase/phospholipase RssA
MPKYAEPVSQGAADLVEDSSLETMTIKMAAQATSAAPTYFPAVLANPKMRGTSIFWDGGLLNNNPIDQLWRARIDLVGETNPPPKVQMVLSVGTSWSISKAPSLATRWPLNNIIDFFMSGWNPSTTIKQTINTMLQQLQPAESAISFLTNTQAKHLDFRRYLNRMSKRTGQPEFDVKYFRFNTPTEGVYYDMAAHDKMAELADRTDTWLTDEDENPRWINDVALLLAKK